MTTTDFLGFEKPSKDDRIKIDVLNDNTDKIDNHFKRNSIVLSTTGKNISVSATGPYYEVTNNNADTVQALLEGNSMLLDPGETFKMNKDATETFTLEVTCASDVTVTYFQRNKDYVDGSLASNLTNYYDKTDSDSIFLKTLDFGNMRKEKSDSICTVDLPLKYNAVGNPVEEYRIHGDTSQPATPTLASAVIPIGTGDLVTDSESEHYNEYALPIINNSIAYNVYLATPLYRVNDKSDYIDYACQKVIRNVGIITYDGSTDEAWENYEYKNYRIDLTNLGGGDNPHISYEVLCDKLLKTSEDNLGIATNRIAICDGKVRVHFNSALTTVSEFKTYLQSNPITVYYPLASEVTEDVTLPELPTISGENQLYVNTTVTPKNVVVGALMQYITIKDLNDTFPGLDNVYTKLEVNSMVNNLNAEVVTKAESVNGINHVNGNISLTLDDVPDGSNRKMEGLATESYVNSAIGNVNSFNVLVVQSLPASDIQQHTIYFVPKAPSENGDVYDEYMYINNAWEHIGTSAVDLSDYYTKSEVNTAISNKAANIVHNHTTTDITDFPTSLPASDVSTWAKEPTKPTYTASEVGLGNVNNTSDLDKPISDATSTALGKKVDKVTGKGLSTNDLTNVLKSNYDTAYTHSQSAHAPSNAEANVQSDWNETDNTSDTFIKNKPTSMPASDVSTWAKATNKPTYTASEVGLGNVPNVATNDQTPTYSEASTLETLTSGEKMSIAFGKIKKAIASLISHTGNISNPHSVTKSQVGLGNVDNTSDANKPVSTATQTALDTKASTTTLTTHTGNADIHVTAADKTAWNLIPKSKAENIAMDIHSYQDFVIPILNIASTCSNEYFYGQIYLKRINGAGQQMTIINLMCGKNYNEEKAVYYIDKTEIWTATKPCSFTYNGKKMFGIHVKITASDYNILSVDARTTTDFGIITPVYIYNNNTSAVLNAEIYNSLSFFDGYNRPMNFYEIPKVIKTDGTATKLLSFSPVPATLTSSGTAGDIAYDTSYMYICTATNVWKRTALTTW